MYLESVFTPAPWGEVNDIYDELHELSALF